MFIFWIVWLFGLHYYYYPNFRAMLLPPALIEFSATPHSPAPESVDG